MENTKTITKRDFFPRITYTEFFIPETSEVWIYGDRYDAINENTPRMCIGSSKPWDTSALEFVSLPITDGHGGVEPKSGYIWEGMAKELSITDYERKISEWYNFNA
jgi:hypothetical protein